MKTRWVQLLYVIGAVAVGCDRLRPQPPPPLPPPKPPEVLFTLPITAEITDYEDFTGRTVAIPTVEIRARVTGYLVEMPFREGAEVKSGDLLFVVDPRPYQAQVDQAESLVKLYESQLALAKTTYARDLDIARTPGAVSLQQLDQDKAKVGEAEAQAAAYRASLDIYKLNLDFTKVTSPIDGQVSRTQRDLGNLVRADDTILTTIVSVDPMYAYFEVDERTMLRIRRYIEAGRLKSHDEWAVSVQMGLQDEEGFPHQGTVNFFDNQIDTNTGTLQVRGVFKNADHVLTPGLHARVRLPIGEPHRAILVSEHALGTDQGQKFVYVIDKDNKAQYRRVEVGKFQQGQRVILKGLAEGERVVTSGLQRIRPGALVQPKLDTPTVQQELRQPASTPEVAAGASAKGSSHK